jgi:hypothetical protein
MRRAGMSRVADPKCRAPLARTFGPNASGAVGAADLAVPGLLVMRNEKMLQIQ